MSDDHEQQATQRTQLTQPKEGKPIEIPVPTEDDFEKLIGRAVPHRPADGLGVLDSGSADD